MLKTEARSYYRDQRNALTEIQRTRLDDLMLIQFQTIELPFLQAMLSYWPIEENNEPDTHLITEFIRFRNPEIRIAYPVSDFKTTSMTAIAVDIDTAFTKKNLNIFEPNNGEPVPAHELDMVLVPLLAFDKKGYRVGYGQGFYDKYLMHCRKDCLKVGLSYFDPVDLIDDCDEFDVPLDISITPKTVYVF